MSARTIEARTRRGIDVRAARRESYVEYFLSGSAEEGVTSSEAAKALYAQVAAALALEGIRPIQEKIYGATSARDAVLSARREELRRRGLDPSPAVTWVEGAPLVTTSAFAGFQLWGIAPREGRVSVETVERPGAPPARCVKGEGFRLVYLPAIRGTRADGTLPAGVTEQAQRMFENAAAAVEAHGLAWRHVVRTWIYLARILDWYGEFNRVRTAYYRTQGLGLTDGGRPYPASTGIQGRSGHDGEECLMDVLAADCPGSSRARLSPIRQSPRQDQAFAYGSAFLRGMALVVEGARTVFVSGTASIDRAGETTHLRDAEGQSLATLMNMAALLEDQGAGLGNICMATLFCKDRRAFDAYREATRLLGVPAFPAVAVQADICRRDLLVEVEAVAVI